MVHLLAAPAFSSDERKGVPWPVSGSLVVLVPSVDGLIIAADSRAAAGGKQCDDHAKILEPSRPDRTVVMAVGTPIVIEGPAQPVSSAAFCEHKRSGQKLLDIGSLVLGYLRHSTVSAVSDLDFADLIEKCMQAVRDARAHDSRVLSAQRGREAFAVVLATYAPETGVSTVRGFAVGLSPQFDPVLLGSFERQVGPTDPRGYWAYGHSDYMDREVLAGPGQKFISDATRRFRAVTKRVSDVTVDEAEAVAVNLIDATSRTTEIVPVQGGIGGPIDVVLIGADTRPQRRHWKTSSPADKAASVQNRRQILDRQVP